MYGFLLANKLGVPFIPVRKVGKLPGDTLKYKYDLEYGSSEVEIHKSDIKGWNVVIHDDLIATGGTACAASEMLFQLGAKVTAFTFVISLDFLNGKEKLNKYSKNIISLKNIKMDFKINENQKMIADMIQQFGKKNITPFVREWDDNQIFPVDVFKKLGELGLMGVLVPEQYGSGFSYYEYVTAIEQLAILDPSIGLSMAAHNSLCTGHILQFGNEEQKKKWLPKLASAEWIGAWGLTEHNTGSDAGGMSTKAFKDGNEWVINGAKILLHMLFLVI